MIYLLLRLKFIYETNSGIELKILCQIDHGPEKNMKFLISIQTPYRHFSNFGVLRMSNFTKQYFPI